MRISSKRVGKPAPIPDGRPTGRQDRRHRGQRCRVRRQHPELAGVAMFDRAKQSTRFRNHAPIPRLSGMTDGEGYADLGEIGVRLTRFESYSNNASAGTRTDC